MLFVELSAVPPGRQGSSAFCCLVSFSCFADPVIGPAKRSLPQALAALVAKFESARGLTWYTLYSGGPGVLGTIQVNCHP